MFRARYLGEWQKRLTAVGKGKEKEGTRGGDDNVINLSANHYLDTFVALDNAAKMVQASAN